MSCKCSDEIVARNNEITMLVKRVKSLEGNINARDQEIKSLRDILEDAENGFKARRDVLLEVGERRLTKIGELNNQVIQLIKRVKELEGDRKTESIEPQMGGWDWGRVRRGMKL